MSASWAVSTRVPGWERRGLEAALSALAPLEPAGILLEAASAPGSPSRIAAALAQAGAPLVGVLAPLDSNSGSIDSQADARPILRGLSQALDLLARCGGRRLILQTGDAGIDGAALMADALDENRVAARDRLMAWREGRSQMREEAATVVLRRLHSLRRAHAGVRWSLLPGPGVCDLLDCESLDWILEDQGGEVGVSLDLGTLGLRQARGDDPVERWLEHFGARTDVVLFSDHDGRRRSSLLPGMGVIQWAEYRDLLPRSVPWVLRPDPEIPLEFLGECRRVLGQWVGHPPEVTG